LAFIYIAPKLHLRKLWSTLQTNHYSPTAHNNSLTVLSVQYDNNYITDAGILLFNSWMTLLTFWQMALWRFFMDYSPY